MLWCSKNRPARRTARLGSPRANSPTRDSVAPIVLGVSGAGRRCVISGLSTMYSRRLRSRPSWRRALARHRRWWRDARMCGSAWGRTSVKQLFPEVSQAQP